MKKLQFKEVKTLAQNHRAGASGPARLQPRRADFSARLFLALASFSALRAGFRGERHTLMSHGQAGNQTDVTGQIGGHGLGCRLASQGVDQGSWVCDGGGQEVIP